MVIVPREPVNATQMHPLTRRQMLRAMLATGAGAVLGPLAAGLGDEALSTLTAATRPATQPTTRPAATLGMVRPWWLNAPHTRSRVVEVTSDRAMTGSVPDPGGVEDLLGQGVQALTEASSPDVAWQRILGPAQRIVLKFDPTAARLLNTTETLARVLVQQLGEAGYHPRTIALLDVPHYLGRALGTRAPERGWGEPVTVAGEPVQLARYLLEADALVNIPCPVAGGLFRMTCCVSQLALSFLRHPARWYDESRWARVTEVIGLEAISGKVRLNLVNALRVVLADGADARSTDLADVGGIQLGYDPVAVDAKALDLVLRERRRVDLDASVESPFMAAAERLGLGRVAVNDVEHIVIGPGRR